MSLRVTTILVVLALQVSVAAAQTAPAPAPEKTAPPPSAPGPEKTAPSETKAAPAEYSAPAEPLAPAEPSAPGEKPPEARAAAPDLVRLKDGGMLRGAISELVAGDHVVIVTVTGETRRFTMDEVSYAGPASQAPAAPGALDKLPHPPAPRHHTAAAGTRPLASVEGPQARLQLKANYPNVTFYVKSGRAKGDFTGYMTGYWGRPGDYMFGEINTSFYERICSAPCSASLPEGRYTLGLGVNDDIVPAERPLDLQGEMDLHGEYVDKSGWRTAGLVVFAGSLIAGLVLMLVDQGEGEAVWFVGAGVAVVGGVSGAIMMAQSDRAYITATRSSPAR